MIQHTFPELDLDCYADPAQHIITADENLDDLDHDLYVDDLSDLSDVWRI